MSYGMMEFYSTVLGRNAEFRFILPDDARARRDIDVYKRQEYPLNRTGQLDLRGVGASQGVWAPCLTYDKGIFYLVYTVVKAFYCNMYDTNNYLVTAESIPLS